ncbi:hypothetical protein ACPOL_1829 [Acidisarcina polymorpha]|uniref:Uncharacterized protein n=1 Tax=Acidisarcina polymorpha TaxID=2211140 RepID=A0A2Z5FWG5_9BACT|nr:hypothetical protein ACPOL_1829 [Acidisarcina polymorpha]
MVSGEPYLPDPSVSHSLTSIRIDNQHLFEKGVFQLQQLVY